MFHYDERPADTMSTPPRCSSEASAEAAPRKTEVGFTLQTLIVTAVLVLVAVAASLGLLAITSSSSDDFEEAGQTGVEARCAPNEIWDQEYEARGIGGPESQGGITSRRVGCKPYCGTWEYFTAGKNDNDEYTQADSPVAMQSGIGGPEGKGGIFSQNIGCFAPCYWSYTYGRSTWRPRWRAVKSENSSLQYFDDNRAPEIRQVRLGVNYRRSTTDPSTDAANLRSSSNPTGTFRAGNRQDLSFFHGGAGNKDGKRYIQTRYKSSGIDAGGGSQWAPGTPMTPALTALLPTVFEPNFISSPPRSAPPGDPAKVVGQGPEDRQNTVWEDENWEYRADPVNKECTIFNIVTDEVVCSSEWENCDSRD